MAKHVKGAQHSPDVFLEGDSGQSKDGKTSHAVKDRVQQLNSLSVAPGREKSKEKSKDGKGDTGTAPPTHTKSKQKVDADAHSLGAWLQDERVLDFINYHQEAKKKGPTEGETKRKGTGKTTKEKERTQDATSAKMAPTAAESEQTEQNKGGPISSTRKKTLISL